MFETNKKAACLTGLEKLVIQTYCNGFEVQFKKRCGIVFLTPRMADKDLCLFDVYKAMERIWTYQREGFEPVYQKKS
jgi:hypothetical protein